MTWDVEVSAYSSDVKSCRGSHYYTPLCNERHCTTNQPASEAFMALTLQRSLLFFVFIIKNPLCGGDTIRLVTPCGMGWMGGWVEQVEHIPRIESNVKTKSKHFHKDFSLRPGIIIISLSLHVPCKTKQSNHNLLMFRQKHNLESITSRTTKGKSITTLYHRSTNRNPGTDLDLDSSPSDALSEPPYASPAAESHSDNSDTPACDSP